MEVNFDLQEQHDVSKYMTSQQYNHETQSIRAYCVRMLGRGTCFSQAQEVPTCLPFQQRAVKELNNTVSHIHINTA